MVAAAAVAVGQSSVDTAHRRDCRGWLANWSCQGPAR